MAGTNGGVIAEPTHEELMITWGGLLEQARDLPDAELRQHALVSSYNRHRCQSCFCCACLTILESREDEETGQ